MAPALEFKISRATRIAAACLSAAALAGCDRSLARVAPAAEPHIQAPDPVAAGRYLVVVGGCNDCHTPGWTTSGGDVPEAKWLTGTDVGWRGPWGVTYPPNLRLLADRLSEDEFVTLLRTRKQRPPMPWMNVNRLSPADARALYAYLKAAGPAGQPAPAALDPGVEPVGPYVTMAPPTIGAPAK